MKSEKIRIFAAIMDISQYTNDAVELLKKLIATPSVSREEGAAADILADFIGNCGLPVKRIGNNVLVCEELDAEKPTLLLNVKSKIIQIQQKRESKMMMVQELCLVVLLKKIGKENLKKLA